MTPDSADNYQLIDIESRAQNRFFGNLLSLLILRSTSTITTTTTVTGSTLTQSCIGSGQFIAGSTNTCSRKRRGIPIEEINALEAIAPTQVEP